MSRTLAPGSVVKLGGLLVVLSSSVGIEAAQIQNGVVVPSGELLTDDRFAELLSHDPVNLRLNVESISREVEEQIDGVPWKVRYTYDANGSPARIPLEKLDEPEADPDAEEKALRGRLAEIEAGKSAAAAEPAGAPVDPADVPVNDPDAPDSPKDDGPVN